eukprot:CAMPEP_0114349648 /NCGR_PEP_ID=MMETSP0101-20121206/15700_1 /TAXON_ID=38822 ORGANISM="Pteridomonas danica, Strain PT" /NCGR_SAMPLE_ID=MMETSP0101 /ASSEMBLY_ACC=CAM_ASM_000211 /LENGTH=119 /DNA_ID=CAMNT_0001488347 /DNA_START=33 /DNA_END=392 /DNA_ORIENTATION=+
MMGLNRMKAITKPLAQRTFATGKAYPLGLVPGRKKEGWEGMIYGFYGASAFLMIVGLANKPSTDIREWARNEAIAREKVVAKGGEVEWGTFYNKGGANGYTFSKSETGTTPVLEEDEEE